MPPFAWPAQRDELREIFNDISSSSEDEEDEGDRHEDEDLNIMDTEDDLDRQLQDKLGESDSAQHESDRNSQIGKSCSAAPPLCRCVKSECWSSAPSVSHKLNNILSKQEFITLKK